MKIASSPNRYQNFNNAARNNKDVNFSGGVSGVVRQFTDKVICNKYTVGAIQAYEKKALSLKPISNVINKLANSPRGFTHLMVLESIFLTGFYMFNTAKNKKIEKEQKFPLMLNDFLVTALATVLNYTLDSSVSKSIKRIQDNVKGKQRKNIISEMIKGIELPDVLKGKEDFLSKEVAGESVKFAADTATDAMQKARNGIIHDIAHKIKQVADPEKIIETTSKEYKDITTFVANIDDDKIKKAAAMINRSDKIISGIGLCKTMIIFTLIYRFLGPVVMTPIANKISSKVKHNKEKKAEAAAKNNSTVTATAPTQQQKTNLSVKA